MDEGFQLNPQAIAEQIGRHISTPGAWLTVYFDSYARPDFDTGSGMVHDPVDRAVVVFVGARGDANRVAAAARAILHEGERHG